MNKEKTLQEIKKNFDEDLKKKLDPLRDIEESVHKDTISELKELFEAVGSFAYDEAKKDVFSDSERKLNSQGRLWRDLYFNVTSHRVSKKKDILKELYQKAIQDVFDDKELMLILCNCDKHEDVHLDGCEYLKQKERHLSKK